MLMGRRLILQFPPPVEEIICAWLAILFRGKPFVVIHDLDHLRNLRNRGFTFFGDKEGFRLLKKCELISHNPTMSKYLKFNGMSVIGELMVFDYSAKSEDLSSGEVYKFDNASFLFAGNLDSSKATFVQDLRPGVENFAIFGPTDSQEISNLKNYMGAFEGNSPPKIVGACYGLIWDGPSAENLVGYYGEYLKINSPFKASLYLAMGLPLIVNRASALAGWVTEQGLGLTVGSVNEITSEMLMDNWINHSRNAKKLQKEVLNGARLGKILNKI